MLFLSLKKKKAETVTALKAEVEGSGHPCQQPLTTAFSAEASQWLWGLLIQVEFPMEARLFPLHPGARLTCFFLCLLPGPPSGFVLFLA